MLIDTQSRHHKNSRWMSRNGISSANYITSRLVQNADYHGGGVGGPEAAAVEDVTPEVEGDGEMVVEWQNSLAMKTVHEVTPELEDTLCITSVCAISADFRLETTAVRLLCLVGSSLDCDVLHLELL